MSPVGHSLVGIAIGAGTAPSEGSRWGRCAAVVALVVAANLPDAPLPGWGHSAYHVSHSLLVTLGGAVVVLLVSRSLCKPGRRLALGVAAAWLSHLLLDSLYNHGEGIKIGWPLGDYRLNLPIPWFQTLDLSQPITSQHNLSVGLLELLSFGPIAAGAWWSRWRRAERRPPALAEP